MFFLTSTDVKSAAAAAAAAAAAIVCLLRQVCGKLGLGLFY